MPVLARDWVWVVCLAVLLLTAASGWADVIATIGGLI